MIKKIKSFDKTEIKFLEIAGKKECIIFLHGAGTNHSVWTPIINHFRKKKHRIISLNLRGHGLSGMSKNISLDAFVEDINQIMSYRKIKKAILIGYSLGASIANLFAVKHPKKVSKIIMITPFSYKIIRCPVLFKSILKFLLLFFPSFNTNRKLRFQDYWKYKNRPFWYHPMIDIRGISLKTYLTSAYILLEYEPDFKINTKTQVIISKNDMLCLRKNIEKKAGKTCEVKIINSDHLALSNNPEEIIDAMQEFI